MELELTICRASEVVELINAHDKQGTPFSFVISIEHPCAENVSTEDGRAPRLVRDVDAKWAERQVILTCWDIEEPVPGASEPQPQIVQDALTHFRKWLEIDQPTADGKVRGLVHCRSGKARSTALALVLLRSYYGPNTEQECLDTILRIRDIAAPNIAIVKHGDDILGCEGKLVQVVLNDEGISRRRVEANITRAHQIESRAGKFAPRL